MKQKIEKQNSFHFNVQIARTHRQLHLDLDISFRFLIQISISFTGAPLVCLIVDVFVCFKWNLNDKKKNRKEERNCL